MDSTLISSGTVAIISASNANASANDASGRARRTMFIRSARHAVTSSNVASRGRTTAVTIGRARGRGRHASVIGPVAPISSSFLSSPDEATVGGDLVWAVSAGDAFYAATLVNGTIRIARIGTLSVLCAIIHADVSLSITERLIWELTSIRVSAIRILGARNTRSVGVTIR